MCGRKGVGPIVSVQDRLVMAEFAPHRKRPHVQLAHVAEGHWRAVRAAWQGWRHRMAPRSGRTQRSTPRGNKFELS